MASTQPLMHKLSPSVDRARHWKPFPLRPTFQISLIVITALCIIAIEVVVQKSGPSYALVLRPRDGSGDFSVGADFVYLYLPTLLSVIYGIAWTWVRLWLPSCRTSDWLDPPLTFGNSLITMRSDWSPTFRCRRVMVSARQQVTRST